MKDIEIPRFVKWAGGKQQLMKQFEPFFPKKFKRYFEPFVGSGAVAFYIIQKFHPTEVFLSDTNEELINAFHVVKTDVEKLIILLKKHKSEHLADSKTYYYRIRKQNPAELPALERAARFIYLNRTCFNGLYRVNAKGQFNVPIGSYKNPDIVQDDKLRKISKLLQNVTLQVMPFEKILDLAKDGDFIYFDPPYYPLKKGNNFTTYTKDNFLEKEHMLLAEVFKKLSQKGCLCMESNSDTTFIHELYSDFNRRVVRARRMINCDASGRGEVNELVITNY
ncbi:DNA adenine methylase [Candidatus Woesearchaeota archaeon]|nr:DNA adenine methylase [Candidatus Woesearchaeota archaeon]